MQMKNGSRRSEVHRRSSWFMGDVRCEVDVGGTVDNRYCQVLYLRTTKRFFGGRSFSTKCRQ